MQGLLDIKKEYTEHLLDKITIPISKRIYDIYNDCIKNKKGLAEFQKNLNNIKNWNNTIIEDEYNKIKEKSNCDYLGKLVKIIIITNIKIKTFEYKNKINNIKIKIPLIQDFIHRCLINAAIFAWKNSYLFWNQNIKQSEKQYHLNLIEKNIKKVIKTTIRDNIPLNEILEQIEEYQLESKKEQEARKEKQVSKGCPYHCRHKLARGII
jgi:hypothetical protein